MLPFVRGVDLSGNDFKVSTPRGGGGPGSRLGSLFRSSPHRSLLPVPPASEPSAAPDSGRGRVGITWGSVSPSRTDPRGLRSEPTREYRCRVGPVWKLGFGVTLEGVGWEPPPRVSVLESGPLPGWRVGWGLLNPASPHPSPLGHPAEVTHPSQALTHCRAVGCQTVPRRVWSSSLTLSCPCHRHPHPVWS